MDASRLVDHPARSSRRIVAIVGLLSMVAVLLVPMAPALASGGDEAPPFSGLRAHWDAHYTPAAEDIPATVVVTITDRTTGTPVEGLFLDVQAYTVPPADTRDDDEVPYRNVQLATTSQATDANGRVTLVITDGFPDGLVEFEVWLDVWADDTRDIALFSGYPLFAVADAGVVGSPRFSDIAGSFHEDEIHLTALRGITEGFADGTFRPRAHLTRGQAATLLSRSLPLEFDALVEFPDAAGSTHARPIGLLAGSGVIVGFPDGTFRPNDVVTRGQMAAFLDRALALPAGGPSDLIDVAGTRYAVSIDAVAAAGITDGFRDGTFRPDEPVTRGQAAAFVVRAIVFSGGSGD